MDEISSFGVWVRRRRKALDLTQAGLARIVPCAEVTVRKIEKDERRPSRQMAERLAEVLQLDAVERDRFIASARAFVSPSRLGSPIPAAAAFDHHLPRPPTSFVGRGSELDDLVGLLEVCGGSHRLVTITGPPGVGKTRLALELANRVERKFDVPAVFVELASTETAAQIRARIAGAVAVPAGAGGDRFDLAVATLGRVATMLVLDNFEQALDGAGVAAEVVERCPELVCVVTSRVRLDLYGEVEYRLDPFEVPGSDAACDPDLVERCAAVALVLDRIAAVDPRADLAGELGDVLRLCQLLEGLPLALELAALGTRRATVASVVEELADDLRALGRGGRDLDPRQQTMTGAIQWSYRLLPERERRVLRCASAIVGSIEPPLVAATAGISRDDAASSIDQLVEHGLLYGSPSGGAGMLAVIRAFAWHELEADGEVPSTLDRLALALVEELEANAATIDAWTSTAAVEAVDRRSDDLATALDWTLRKDGDRGVGRRLAVATGYYWTLRSRPAEGASWMALAYEAADDDEQRVAPAYFWAECLFGLGQLDAAAPRLDEAVELARSAGTARWLAQALGNRGMFRLLHGDLDGAERDFTESLDLTLSVGGEEALAIAHMRMGRLCLVRNDTKDADAHNDRALALYRSLGDTWGTGTALGNRGDHLMARGLPGAAIEPYLEAIETYLDGDYEWYAATRVESVANALVASGTMANAARAYGMADQWLADLQMPPHPVTSGARAEHEAAARAALGTEFDVLAAAGGQLPRGKGAIVEWVRSRSLARPADRHAGVRT